MTNMKRASPRHRRTDHRILVGDYSNGNDAVLARGGLQLKDLAAKKMLLVEKTVSGYLFDRAMTINGLRDQIKRVRMINTSDSDIATAFIGDASASAVVTWKPMVSQIAKQKGAHRYSIPRKSQARFWTSPWCAQTC